MGDITKSDAQVIPGRAVGGETTVLRYGGDVTVETSLSTMYDAGREAGLRQGRVETEQKLRPLIEKARREGREDGIRVGILQGQATALVNIAAFLKRVARGDEPAFVQDIEEDDDGR